LLIDPRRVLNTGHEGGELTAENDLGIWPVRRSAGARISLAVESCRSSQVCSTRQGLGY